MTTMIPSNLSLLLCLLVATAAACALLPTGSSAKSLTSLTEATSKKKGAGAFDGVESETAKVASRIRSVKDLGWTAPEKRAGSARPRHRAFGGEGEEPIQAKANYDETNPNVVEKWSVS
jgi:hypothetical protein